ncbi:hypothetical protein Poli38472_010136 [Pythium oligandrum]|uniref:Ankyrin repeat-containing domain n=1 Tax=Pythium oligandrum TaxID=41045 RepID=A0A8K1FGD2_PYTOL|nr:hypothetical protein Poli38472_010136 [Pythium oligandrum]|eukprot:TMW58577.1 hypothetical protein Poli38472_010136 [Pythium oligandrum]
MASVVLNAEWLHALLLPLLAHDDAVRLAVVALDARFDTLWHALMYDRSPIAPIQPRELLPIAIESGWWHIVVLFQRSSRPHHQQQRAHSTLKRSSDKAFALCQWVQRRHPIRFDKEAMYAAVRRGCLEEVQWLSCITEYDGNEALRQAAEACHLHVVKWLLGKHKTGLQRFEVVWEDEGFYWYDDNEGGAMCAMKNHGLLPPHKFSRSYPLMDWAAQRGDLSLLQRLHVDGFVCTSEAFNAAIARGDIEMIQWLHENRKEHVAHIDRVYEVAARENQVTSLEWLHKNSVPLGSLYLVVQVAARGGHLETVRWLFDHCGENINRPNYLLQAALSGNLDLLRLGCHEYGCQVSFRVMEAAAYRRYHEAVRWLANVNEASLKLATENAKALLDASAHGGSLELVKWCVENLGAWSREAAWRAVRGQVSVLEYLHTKAQERATIAKTSLQDQLDFSQINAVHSYLSKIDEETVCWLLEHIPEQDQAVRGGHVEHFMLVCQSPSRKMPSWRFMRKLMECRPMFCCRVPIFPQLVVQFGFLSDLETLKTANHPDLFTKTTLDFILGQSRDDTLMEWFVNECGSTFLTVHFYRIVGWAAKYGATRLLTVLLAMRDKNSALWDKGDFKLYGSIIWPAIRHNQASVLDWIDRQDHASELTQRLWTKRVAKMAAQRGALRCLLWLHTHGKIPDERLNEMAGITACSGQVRCLQSLYRARGIVCSSLDVLKAARKGHIDVVECILTHQPRLFDDLLSHKLEGLRP